LLTQPVSTLIRQVQHAHKVVCLADNGDQYLSDVQSLSTFYALVAAKDGPKTKDADKTIRPPGPQVVVQVSKQSSARLIDNAGGNDTQVAAVENMTNRLLAQCMRSKGLTKVARHTLVTLVQPV
jgi:hypothetical protein